MRITRARIVGATALATTAAAAGVAAGVSGGDGGPAASSHDRRAGATARVERRDLVDTETVDGTLGYADQRPAANRLSGTYTWLPHEGQLVAPGQTLWKVDAEPVILMDGGVPAYRNLRSGEHGADVRQLERNLAVLGYAPGTVDGTFDASTAAAVKRWQRDHGLQATGVVEAGRVVFLPGPRRVGTLAVSVGDSAGSGAAGDSNNPNNKTVAYHPASATVPSSTVPPSSAVPSSSTPASSATPPSTTTPSTTKPSPRGNPNSNPNNNNPAADNPSVGNPTKVMETTSARRVVTIDLDAAKQQLAHRGDRASVELPDGSTVPGRIASVGRVAQTATGDQGPGQDASPTITVTVRLTGRGAVAGLDEAPVSVRLIRAREHHVLAVPVTALVATGSGGYAVEAVGAGDATHPVRVTPGLFAGGYVAVHGSGVHEGMTITVPSDDA